MVAYDGSDHATRALEIGVEYAEKRGCTLHLVCVRGDAREAAQVLEEACDYARGHSVEPIPMAMKATPSPTGFSRRHPTPTRTFWSWAPTGRAG